ncbi:MAG: TIGR02996 domain-containing protein [Deltaproteobacteria bacterium]|nr:TIGR02996 domain-containing protein [Deltaproteobacteria bacterium]
MRLELAKGTSTHWFELILDNKKFQKLWGQTNVASKQLSKTYRTPAKAKTAHDAFHAELIAKGYRDPARPGVAPAKDTPRNPALEAAIRANRDDPGVYQVYADWLQQQGNPLGELIVLSQANKKAAAARIIDKLGFPGHELAKMGWRHGMWQWLRLENNHDWYDTSFDPAELARTVFAQPACAALEELRIGMLRWDHNDTDVPAVLDEAKKFAWSADLVSLRLGDDVDRNINMAHHCIGDVAKRISKTFPRLRRLFLHSGEEHWRQQETFGLRGLALPELRELTIETCSLSKARLAAVLAAKLPKLEKLELWFGSTDYHADASIKGLTKLLDGSAFPNLRHLGLCNAELENEIAIALTSSKIAGKLESLDLSRGTLTELGAEALIASAKSFPRLKALALDRNFLSAQTIRAVTAKFPFATAEEQKEPDDSVEGETHYYVSVAE